MHHVVMDVHLLQYVDSTGIAAIFSTKSALEGVGRRLCLVGCHGLVSKILRSALLEDEVLRFDDMDEALSKIEL
jgi:anti-anti-sigma factor